MSCIPEDLMVHLFNNFFELDVTKDDLINCKPELVQKIYALFAKDFGDAVEKLSLVPINAPQSMHQYPEMYRGILFVSQLGKLMKDYLSIIKPSEEFHLRDVINPVWSRTRRFFSIFLNFYQVISENVEQLQDVENEVGDRRKLFGEKKDAIEELGTLIREREKQNAENEVRKEKLVKVVEAAKQDIKDSQDKSSRLKGRVDGLKEEITDLVSKLKDVELMVLEGNQRILSLKSQVILEDELNSIKEEEERLSASKANCDSQKERIKELKECVEMPQKVERLVKNSLLPIAKDYEAEVKAKNELMVQSKEEEREMIPLREREEELLRAIQMLTESIAFLEEDRNHILRSKETKKIGLVEDVKRLKHTLEELQRGKDQHEIVDRDLESEYELVLRERRELEQRLNTFIIHFNNSVAQFEAMFAKAAEKDLENIRSMLK